MKLLDLVVLLRLRTSVTEGLQFVKLIDRTLDKKGGLANIRKAADFFWVRVELYHKWQDKDLDETTLKRKNAEEIVKELYDKAGKTFFKQLSIMIADILAACLTNLPHVIAMKCRADAIEESVRKAVLLGETEDIQQRDWPILDPDRAGKREQSRLGS